MRNDVELTPHDERRRAICHMYSRRRHMNPLVPSAPVLPLCPSPGVLCPAGALRLRPDAALGHAMIPGLTPNWPGAMGPRASLGERGPCLRILPPRPPSGASPPHKRSSRRLAKLLRQRRSREGSSQHPSRPRRSERGGASNPARIRVDGIRRLFLLRLPPKAPERWCKRSWPLA